MDVVGFAWERGPTSRAPPRGGTKVIRVLSNINAYHNFRGRTTRTKISPVPSLGPELVPSRYNPAHLLGQRIGPLHVLARWGRGHGEAPV